MLSTSMESSLQSIGRGLVSYVVDVVFGDGKMDLVVVFRPEPGEDPVASAKGRLQWFMMIFVGVGQIKEIGTDLTFEAVYPFDTLFLISEMPNEAFWCGPSEADPSVVRQAAHLPDALHWDWEKTGQVVVNEVTLSIGET